MKTQVITLLFVSFFMMAGVIAAQENISDDCRDLDVVNYGPPGVSRLKDRIIIKKATDKAIPPSNEETEKRSPQGTCRFIFLERPDFTKEGPWITKARIVGNKAHPVNLTIEFRDHYNQDVQPVWLNEKLLFLRVWWGRLVSSDIILNVETGDPVYLEEAGYHNLVVPCDEKRRK